MAIGHACVPAGSKVVGLLAPMFMSSAAMGNAILPLMVGYLNRAGILSAWTKQAHEEAVREPGWLRKSYHGRKGAADSAQAG